MGRKIWGRWLSVLVALVFTVLAVAVLSLTSSSREMPDPQASETGPAELSEPPLGQQEVPIYVSIGGFVLILLVPALGGLALARPKEQPKSRRAGRKDRGGFPKNRV